jgi:hypothetical protein
MGLGHVPSQRSNSARIGTRNRNDIDRDLLLLREWNVEKSRIFGPGENVKSVVVGFLRMKTSRFDRKELIRWKKKIERVSLI